MPLDLRSESVLFQWDFYERAVNNYSIVLRIMDCLERGDGLIDHMPKVFVEESLFDMCTIVSEENGSREEGFFSIDGTRGNIDLDDLIILNGGASSPSVINAALGYQTLYLYPLKEDMEPTGFLMMGKRFPLSLDERFLRELEIVCGIYRKSLSLQSKFKTKESLSPGFYEKALNELTDALFLVDRNGAIGYANKQAKKQFEGQKGCLIGDRIDHIVPGISAGPLHGEIMYKSGSHLKILNVESYPIKKDRSWRGFVFKDVVGEKIEEEEKLLKGKMDSMGMLAGGIAHDFNNLLTGVLGYASLLRSFTRDEKLYRYAEVIEESAQRAAALTRHLLSFSRRQRKAAGPVDLNALASDILFLMGESFRDLEIEKTMDEDLPPVQGDEADLQNALLTLCMHAKGVMQGQGSLKVKTRQVPVGGRDFASIEIEHTGQMIDDMGERICEPSVTTDQTCSKLARSLYLVDKVIREHGGFVDCERGEGTRFTLYLPLPFGIVGKQAGPESTLP